MEPNNTQPDKSAAALAFATMLSENLLKRQNKPGVDGGMPMEEQVAEGPMEVTENPSPGEPMEAEEPEKHEEMDPEMEKMMDEKMRAMMDEHMARMEERMDKMMVEIMSKMKPKE